jgi:HEPN domain-containing protein
MKTDETNPHDWLLLARERLEAADALFQVRGPTFSGVELLQEAVERYLKAYLITRGWKLLKIHNLSTLLENSMDVDPVTESEEIAMLGYDAMIGSDFEKKHGWHVNLMPRAVLQEFPADWRTRAETSTYGLLTVIVPSVEDLLIPKLKRGEPRDRKHIEWSKALQK